MIGVIGGMLIGLFLGGFLVEWFGIREVFLLVGIILLIFILMIIFMVKEDFKFIFNEEIMLIIEVFKSVKSL